MILYFSGTGNSRYVAERIAAVTGEELIDVNAKIRNRDTGRIVAGAWVVIVTPTYAWRIPRVVEEWIRETEFAGAGQAESHVADQAKSHSASRDGLQAWFVMTCGDEAGNACKYNLQLCAAKGWDYMGTAQVVMPENYLAMFPVPKPSTAQKIIRNAEPVIDEIAGQIAQGNPVPDGKLTAADRLKSGFVNAVFYSMFLKAGPFHATDACIGCGKCESLCPLHNIALKDGRPVWGKDCTHCMACIAYCPTEAIEYGKASVGKPRYHCDLKGK